MVRRNDNKNTNEVLQTDKSKQKDKRLTNNIKEERHVKRIQLSIQAIGNGHQASGQVIHDKFRDHQLHQGLHLCPRRNRRPQ